MKKSLVTTISLIIFLIIFVGLFVLCGYMTGGVQLPSDLTRSAQSVETVYAKVTADIGLINIELTKMALEPGATLVPTPSINSQNWFKDFVDSPTCQIPCWENITPNKTDIDTATRIIANIPGVQIIFLDPRRTVWYFGNKSSSSGAVTANQESVIIQIDIELSEDEILTLNDVVKLYGDPHAILEGIDCNFIVSYRYQGMLLSIREPTCSRKPADMKPETRIDRIILFSPDNQEFTLNIYWFHMDEIMWDGYRIYDFRNP